MRTKKTTLTRPPKRTSSPNSESSSTRFGPRTLVSETRHHFGRHFRSLHRDHHAESTRHRPDVEHHDDGHDPSGDHDERRGHDDDDAASSATTCQGSAFSGLFNEGEGAAGTVYASVTLTKRSAGTCSIKGWPILTLQDKSGAVLPLNLLDESGSHNAIQFSAAKANEPPALLTMTNGSVTNFSLAYSSVQTGNTVCDNAVTISVQFATGDRRCRSHRPIRSNRATTAKSGPAPSTKSGTVGRNKDVLHGRRSAFNYILCYASTETMVE